MSFVKTDVQLKSQNALFTLTFSIIAYVKPVSLMILVCRLYLIQQALKQNKKYLIVFITMAFAWKASHGHVANLLEGDSLTHSLTDFSLNRQEQTCLQSLQLE